MAIWETVLGTVTKPVSEYFTRRQEIKAQDRQQERAIKAAQVERQIELIKQGMHADATWELESLKAHTGGWKDEFVLIMFAIPFILCFIPSMAPYVGAGFSAIAGTPVWYQIGSMSVFLATYGIRWWRRTQSDT
jgi:hypothetical protein